MAKKFSERGIVGRNLARISTWSAARRLKIQADEGAYKTSREHVEQELKTYIGQIDEIKRDQGYGHIDNVSLERYKYESDYLNTLKKNLETYDKGKLTLRKLKNLDAKAESKYIASMEKLKDRLKVVGKLEMQAMKHQGKARGKELESRIEKIVAVVLIVIGASIILSTDVTITTYSVIPEYEDQGKFFIVGILLIALGIFLPSLAFIKNLIKKSKNKSSKVIKKKKKGKK